MANHRRQGFFGNNFREQDIVFGVGSHRPVSRQLGGIGGQNVTSTGEKCFGQFGGLFDDHRLPFQPIFSEKVCGIHFGGGSRQNTYRGATQFLCTFYAQFFRH